MIAMAFDTHAFIKKLVAAGMPERQAEVLAEEQARLIEDRLATKHDLIELEKNLDLKVELKLSSLRVELIKWMVGVSTAQAAVILAALKFFH